MSNSDNECQLCGKPLRAGNPYGYCSRTMECRTQYARARYASSKRDVIVVKRCEDVSLLDGITKIADAMNLFYFVSESDSGTGPPGYPAITICGEKMLWVNLGRDDEAADFWKWRLHAAGELIVKFTPADLRTGLVDQALRWLANPHRRQKGSEFEVERPMPVRLHERIYGFAPVRRDDRDDEAA